MANKYDKPFSVENFIELFNSAASRKYLPADVLASINLAIEVRDEKTLKRLFPSLVDEYNYAQETVRDFMNKKDEIFDAFSVECRTVRKKYIEEPREKERLTAEKRELHEAEKLLNDI